MKKAFCDKCEKPALHAAKWNQNVRSNLGGAWERSIPVGSGPLAAMNMMGARTVQPHIEAWIGFHWVHRKDGNTELDLCAECAVALLDELREKLLKQVSTE